MTEEIRTEELADLIRAEANLASRAGQSDVLSAIADKVERLQRGARELGRTIEQQCNMVLDITGLHDWVDETGDGDWGAIWDHALTLKGRAEKAEADAVAREAAARREALLEARGEVQRRMDDAELADGGKLQTWDALASVIEWIEEKA